MTTQSASTKPDAVKQAFEAGFQAGLDHLCTPGADNLADAWTNYSASTTPDQTNEVTHG